MMNRLLILLALALAAVPAKLMAQEAAPAAADPTAGAPLRAPVMMIVDVQKLLRESNAAKSIQGQIGALRSNFQKEIADEEKSLSEQEKALSRKRTSLSAEAFTAERRKFEQSFASAQRKVQMHKRQLDIGLSKALVELRSNIVTVVREIAKERNADLVLNDQQVIIVNSSLDVTDEVMRRLNAKISDIKVVLPPLPANSGSGSK